MKKLLLLWLFSGSLDGFSQVDTTQLLRQFEVNRWSIKLPDTSVRVWQIRDFYPKPDTIPSHLLISHTPPSFGHSIEGYCICSDWGVCTGKHLVRRKVKRHWVYIPVKEKGYDVWLCIHKGGQSNE